MSLFRCREVWSVEGPSSDVCDGDALIVDYFDGEPCVWLGSHDGYLRAYSPQPISTDEDSSATSRREEHLLYEMRCDAPVLQLARGRFTLLEAGRELAVLHPTSVCIYNIVRTNSEHNPLSLTLVQQHSINRPAYCLVTGTFGLNLNRDFICVQSLDCLLTFFQQEGGSVNITLEKMLLPSRMAYLPRTDEFVYQDAHLHVVCYRYQHLLTNGKPEWTHNIGESIVDLQVVLGIEEEQTMVVLCERSLSSLASDGSIVWVVRLQRPPMCQHSYLPITADKVMSLVCYDDGQLEVYQTSRLMWAAKIDVPVLTVKLVHLANQLPHLLFVTLQGQLECAYLGTQPWLYLMPSAPEPEIPDVAAAEKELQRLHTVINNNHATGAAVAEEPLNVCLHVDSNRVTAKLTAMTPLTNVQVVLSVESGLMVDRTSSKVVASLISTEELSWHVNPSGVGPVSSLIVRLFVVYTAPGAGVRVKQCNSVLGWGVALQPCPPAPAQDSPAKLTLTTAQAPVPPGSIFGGEKTAQAAGVMSPAGGSPVTLLAGKTSRRYRVQADRMEDMCLAISQLVDTPGVDITFPGPLPMHEVIALITNLHGRLTALRHLSLQLSQLTSQYRTLQKKVLGNVKDTQSSADDSLYRAMDLTYSSMCVCIAETQEQQQQVTSAACRLSAICALVNALLPCMQITPEDRITLGQVFSPHISCGQQQGWLETICALVSLLLKTRLAKSTADQNKTLQPSLEPLTPQQLPKLIKMFTSVVDRATRGASLLERSEFDSQKELQMTVPTTKEWKDEIARAASSRPRVAHTSFIKPTPAPKNVQPIQSSPTTVQPPAMEKKPEELWRELATTDEKPTNATERKISPPASEPQDHSIWDIDIDDVII